MENMLLTKKIKEKNMIDYIVINYILILLLYIAGVVLAAVSAKLLNESWIIEEDYDTKFPTIFIILSWASVVTIIIAVFMIYTIKNIFAKDGSIRKFYSKLDNWIQNANS